MAATSMTAAGPLAVPASSPSSTRSRSRESTHSSVAMSSDPSAGTPPPQDGQAFREDLPVFLRQTRSEIHGKFVDLEWQQRNRLAQGRQGVEAASEWARLTGDEVGKRNRYLNVEPFLNNRIRLRVPEGQSDYINASPIMLRTTISGTTLNYIATQGPKEGIHSHIWRMIWHETSDPAVIVMLTQTHEAGREKCFQYFPHALDDPVLEIVEDDEFLHRFTATVTLLSLREDFDARCTVRELELTLKESAISPSTDESDDGDPMAETTTADATDASSINPPEAQAAAAATAQSPAPSETPPAARKVWHMLFAAWPDFLIPEGDDRLALLRLIRLVSAKSKLSSISAPSPPIVHCSAGVGRSGTFIALDFLLTELAEGALDAVPDDEDPVVETVDRLRRQRMMMVQSEAQFAFLYDVLREQWLERVDGKAGVLPVGIDTGTDESSSDRPSYIRHAVHHETPSEATEGATDAYEDVGADVPGLKRHAEPPTSAAKMARLAAELEAEMRHNAELV